MYKYIATWNYNGAKNKNTFVNYFESERSDIKEVTLKIRSYICIRYNWNDVNLSVIRENIDYITV